MKSGPGEGATRGGCRLFARIPTSAFYDGWETLLLKTLSTLSCASGSFTSTPLTIPLPGAHLHKIGLFATLRFHCNPLSYSRTRPSTRGRSQRSFSWLAGTIHQQLISILIPNTTFYEQNHVFVCSGERWFFEGILWQDTTASSLCCIRKKVRDRP